MPYRLHLRAHFTLPYADTRLRLFHAGLPVHNLPTVRRRSFLLPITYADLVVVDVPGLGCCGVRMTPIPWCWWNGKTNGRTGVLGVAACATDVNDIPPPGVPHHPLHCFFHNTNGLPVNRYRAV